MKKHTFLFTLVAAGVITFGWWSYRSYYEIKKSNQSIHFSLDNLVESLDPAKAFSDDSLLVSSQVYEPLFQYHYLKRPYEVQPLIAQSLPQITENGLKYLIKIKPDIYYHPHPALPAGRMVKAQDYINQFKRVAFLPFKSPGRNLFNSIVKGFEEFSQKVGNNESLLFKESISGVKAIEDDLIEIELIKPDPNLINYLAMNFIVPLPIEYLQSHNNLDHMMIGTGPYVFEGIINNEFYYLKRYKHYRLDYYPSAGDRYANVQNLLNSSKEQIPFIDEVRFYFFSSEDEKWQNFLNRKINVLNVPKKYLSSLYDKNGDLSEELKEREIEIKHFPILANRWLAFNMKHPVLGKNLNLRKAIAHAIDYDKYISLLSQNTNLRANSILVPGLSGYRPQQESWYNYDLELSKKFLEKSGFKDNKKPHLIYSTRGNQDIHLAEANFIKDELGKIGLSVEIELLSFVDFLKKGRAGELMFFTDNWFFDYPDGENILQLLVSWNSPGVNKSAYRNIQVDQAYEKLKTINQIEAREKIMQQIEDLVKEDLPWIPLMYESSYVIHYPTIKNFRKSSIIRNYVKYLKHEG